MTRQEMIERIIKLEARVQDLGASIANLIKTTNGIVVELREPTRKKGRAA